jgi:hypothetical protein
MKKFKKFYLPKIYLVLFGLLALIIIPGCTGSTNDEAEEIDYEEAVVVEVDYWLIDEHAMNDVPLTSKAEVKPKSDSKQAVEADREDDALIEAEALQEEEAEEIYEAEEAYDIAMMEELHEDLMEAEYEAENTFVVTQAAVLLDETQTVVAYNKKGAQISAIQVVSSGDGEVEQVIFVDKKHRDVYDVQAGMSGKEVKKLRKELKHMVKKGQVFLYDDESNIMYLTDIQNMAGDEITEADIENSEVSAIVWKDKKHHKKEKKNKK